MNSMSAFANGDANRHKELMVFDWDKAARLINEKNPSNVTAGLAGDWEWTGGTIFENGEPVLNGGAYLSSTWATPEISLDGDVEDCYKMDGEVQNWDNNWSKQSLSTLNNPSKEK